MKSLLKFSDVVFLFLFFFTFTACNNSDPVSSTDSGINPFSNGSLKRNMIVVMSDMHLGSDPVYAQCKNNLPALENLIKKIRVSPNVSELVIAGDLVDEWYVPATTNTYGGNTQAAFVSSLAAANSGVFAALNSIIQDGLIKVTYLPGNHDLGIVAASIDGVLPGVNQGRDALGVGSYSPVGLPKIIIEHGNRYNFIASPDPVSNQSIAPGTILPPGYFFTRIAALSAVQGSPAPVDSTPVVFPNTSGGESQRLLFNYWKTWFVTLHLFPISNRFDENIIVTNINGFTGAYKIKDLVPYQLSPGGVINVNFFNGIQDTWEARQTRNNVSVHIPVATAIDSANSNTFIDYQSSLQYFMNPSSDKRLVVFGHTHAAKITAYQNYANEKCVYANTGTWVDNNQNNSTTNFVVITPQSSEISTQTLVKLYKYTNQVVTMLDENSVRF